MRLANQANKLNTGGVEAQGSFKIKGSGKAFRILIDSLYSDKIQSIVRELASNAFDSHKLLGTKQPFYIHCPTNMRPEFFVRDYGVGMSDEKVMNLYSTLFDSDKDSNNDLVGAFGLGSKSPFAYTEQFCVTCYDGVNARHYGAAIGEGGVPQIILLQTEPCAEPLGIRVSFNVDRKDFDEFKKAINRVSLGFDPLFETNITLEQKRGKALLSGTGWTSYDRSTSNLPSEYNVLQGCVIYPLEATGGISLPRDYSRQYLFEVPIGKVEVTSSREAISYSAPVIEYLKERVKDFVEEYPKLIEKRVGKIDNVAAFFAKITELRPDFLKDKFDHKETGLKDTTVQIAKPGCIMTVQYTDRNQRWDYSFSRTSECRTPKAEKKTVIEITDITPMLDVARENKDGFSPREHRRISRLLRNYLEVNNRLEGVFWLGLPWTDRFVELTQPNVERVKMTVEDLMAAVPSRRGRPVEELIRGVALLKGDSTEHRPVSAIEATPGECAWVTADQFRKEPRGLRVIAKKYGVTEFYIAASAAYKKMEASAVPKLADHIDAKLKAEHGVSWTDWTEAHKMTRQFHRCWNADYLINFCIALNEKAPDQLQKLARSKTYPGEFARTMMPFVKAKLLPISASEVKDAVQALSPGDDGKEHTPFLKLVSKLVKQLTNNDASPAVKFLGNLTNASTPKQMAMTVDGIIAIFKAMPLTVKTNWKDY